MKLPGSPTSSSVNRVGGLCTLKHQPRSIFVQVDDFSCRLSLAREKCNLAQSTDRSRQPTLLTLHNQGQPLAQADTSRYAGCCHYLSPLMNSDLAAQMAGQLAADQIVILQILSDQRSEFAATKLDMADLGRQVDKVSSKLNWIVGLSLVIVTLLIATYGFQAFFDLAFDELPDRHGGAVTFRILNLPLLVEG